MGGTKNGVLYLWHGEGYDSVNIIRKHDCEIIFCKFSSGDDHFVSADRKGCIFLWHLTNTDGKLEVSTTSLELHTNTSCKNFPQSSVSLQEISLSMIEVQFSPIQAPWQRIVTINFEGTALHLYHTTSGDLVKKMEGNTSAPITQVLFSSSGGQIASGDLRGHVIIWDGSTGDFQKCLKVEKAVSSLAFVCADKYICTGHKESVQIYEIADGSCVTHLLLSTSISTLCASVSQPWIACCEENESVNFLKIHTV